MILQNRSFFHLLRNKVFSFQFLVFRNQKSEVSIQSVILRAQPKNLRAVGVSPASNFNALLYQPSNSENQSSIIYLTVGFNFSPGVFADVGVLFPGVGVACL